MCKGRLLLLMPLAIFASAIWLARDQSDTKPPAADVDRPALVSSIVSNQPATRPAYGFSPDELASGQWDAIRERCQAARAIAAQARGAR